MEYQVRNLKYNNKTLDFTISNNQILFLFNSMKECLLFKEILLGRYRIDNSQILYNNQDISSNIDSFNENIKIIYPYENFVSNLTILENFNECNLDYEGAYKNYYPEELTTEVLNELAILKASNSELIIAITNNLLNVKEKPIIILSTNEDLSSNYETYDLRID